MDNRWLRTLQFVLLLALGVLLIGYAFRKISMHDLVEQLNRGHYWVAVPVLMISAFGYWCRSLRVKIMLQRMSESCRLSSIYAALCMGYAVSFAVPRLGEVIRALVVKRTDNVKVDLMILVIIVERVLDTLMLGVLALVAFVAFHTELYDLYTHHLSGKMESGSSGLKWLFAGFVIIIGLVVLILVRKQQRVQAILLRYLTAIKGLGTVYSSGVFWITTALIWCCYFLMTYLWVFVFDETSGLTWSQAFLVMVVGSFGRSIPIQGGGMGAYHFLVGQVLLLLGIQLVTGNALAVVIHGAQAVFTMVMGLLSYLWMLLDMRKAQLKSAVAHN